MLAMRVRNFKASIHQAFALMTQYPAAPPPAALLIAITNQVQQFLGDARELENQGLLTPAQIAYCNYFRQLWLQHNTWWPQCVNAIAQLAAMAQ